MREWWLVLTGALVVAVPLAQGCSESDGEGGGESNRYAATDMWLCRPDIEDDQCDVADLSFTAIEADGSRATGDVPPETDAPVDCFYVYHTVNNSSVAGNTEEPSTDDPDIVQGLLKQGVHFRGVCRMFAPLYRQMTLGTYFMHPWVWEETEFFEKAYGDVAEAFDYYLDNHNEGRGFVLIGHSQGSHVLARLMEDRVDDDEGLRSQLVSAMLGGPGARMQVPVGETVGGTFDNIPACQSGTQTGCVVGFDAVAAGGDGLPDLGTLIPAGAQRLCVNPSSLGDSSALASLTFPRSEEVLSPSFPEDVETEWVAYPGLYEGSCRESDGALEVDLVSDDPREPPFTPQELQAGIAAESGTPNLHWGEPFMTVGDLVRVVEMQAANY